MKQIRLHPLVAVAIAMPLGAQATHASARILLGAYLGVAKGSPLWQVNDQPIRMQSPYGVSHVRYESFDLSRQVASDLTLGVTATSFISSLVGVSAEVSHTGLKAIARCSIDLTIQENDSRTLCTSMNGEVRNSSATTLLAGVVLRPMDRKRFQFYLTARMGLAVVTDKMTTLTGTTILNGLPATIVIYPAESHSGLKLNPQLGLGFTTNYDGGVQIHGEVRQSWLSLAAVTGPAPHEGVNPPSRGVVQRSTQLLIGFTLVLDKSYGRRY